MPKGFHVAAVLALTGVSLAEIPLPYISPGNIHKVQIADRQIATQTVARGSKPIADYGSFQLMEVDRREFDRLTASSSSAIARDEYNVVEFLGHPIDTSVEPAQQPVPGRSLHVIHFRGPVRPEWLQQVDAARCRIVTPISYNAYLLLGTERDLAVAVKSAGVQWSAPYAASYKMDPKLNSGSSMQVAIQLLEDGEWNVATLALIESSKTDGQTDVSKALGYVNVIATVAANSLGPLASRPDVISIQPYATPKRR